MTSSHEAYGASSATPLRRTVDSMEWLEEANMEWNASDLNSPSPQIASYFLDAQTTYDRYCDHSVPDAVSSHSRQASGRLSCDSGTTTKS